MLYEIQRTECGKELRGETIAGGFRTYEAALGRLKKIAGPIGAEVTKDHNGLDIIHLTDGKTTVHYSICGENETLNHKPQIFH